MTLAAAQHEAPPREGLDALADALFHPMGADGVYARTGLYEGGGEALAGLSTRHRPDGAEVMRLPPVMSRRQLEASGYLNSFPNLLGCVSCLHGSEAEIRRAVAGAGPGAEPGEDWTGALAAADLVLTPAACYPVYPIAAARGPVPAAGLVFDVACDCFRREPSRNLDRLQSFRMREYVCIGAPEQILAFREAWIGRAKAIAERLALRYQVDLASDPFFGRASHFMAASQIRQSLKFELLVPVASETAPTACMSFNYHQDHFGQAWDLRRGSGEAAHTGCVAFGMDRLALALFATHGVETRRWPEAVRATLAL